MKAPSFSLGLEEEYLLVDPASRDLAVDPPEQILRECAAACRGQVSPELLRPQIEVGTQVCRSIAQARSNLAELRGTVSDVARRHGLDIIAASTHPFASWLRQKQTPKPRYALLTEELQAAARRLLICGMHVHVGVEDDELRIDLMNQLSYFLPHMLALSCSSPFWEGGDTGLKSYRLTVFDALPRTGIPERFDSYAEYLRHVAVLTGAGIIDDATELWWDVRPSFRYPTLETRVMDVCTSLEDAICLAAVNLCVLRMLYRLRLRNLRWRTYRPMLLRENRWRAMRYAFDEGLIDLAVGRIVPMQQLVEELLALIAEDAEALSCTAEVAHMHRIMQRGTSAHRQLAVFQDARGRGVGDEAALYEVVDYLIAETRAGL